jgi:hypothetical protein
MSFVNKGQRLLSFFTPITCKTVSQGNLDQSLSMDCRTTLVLLRDPSVKRFGYDLM